MVVCFFGPESDRRPHFRAVLLRLLAAPAFLIIVLSLFAASLTGTAVAQTYLNPHGGFSSSTQLCQICHSQHEAPGNKLVRGNPESALCFTCHNGTGSNYDIQTELNLNPSIYAMHPINVNLPNNNGQYNYVPNTTAGAPLGPYACTQCHNPHGDNGFGKLLRNVYNTSAYVTYPAGPDPYTACWSCHNSNAIVNDTVNFPRHNSHIVTHQAPCTACHYSPHGAPTTELVRFNPAFVTPSVAANAGPSFLDTGNHTGSCTLSCHGADHNNVIY